MNLRDFAECKVCQVRIHNCCNHNPDTVVLAHIRRRNLGTGNKPPYADLAAVYACSDCHDVIDGRVMLPNLSKLELDRYILEALVGTLHLVGKAICDGQLELTQTNMR